MSRRDRHKASASSIVDRVGRAQLLTTSAAMALVVSVGALAGGVVSLRREDAVSLGQAEVLRAEIAEPHAHPAALEAEVRQEIREQAGFGRRIEVWRGPRRVGDDGTPAVLGPRTQPSGTCRSERRAGQHVRVCALAAPRDLLVLVAAPLDPLYDALLGVSGAMAAVALIAILVLVALGRRLVARVLRPLSTFAERLAAVRPDRIEERLPAAWGPREIDELAAAFNAMLQRLDEAMARERRILLDVSHELRSPLSRLAVQLDLLIEGAADARLAAPLRRAAAACAGLVRLTESVLALGRGELPAGETVNLCDVAREHAAELAAREPALAARVRVDVPDEALLRADPALVRLCLANLVDNALKFSEGPVWIAVREAAGAVVLRIEDRGPGLPEEELRRAGEPLFRGSRDRGRVPGSGLGLALVRHVAQQYGGGLALARPAEGGLRAEFTLPAWQPAPG